MTRGRYYPVMAPRSFAILDPAAGISGDMLLGALLDAGAPEAWLKSLPERLGFPGVQIEAGRVLRCGIACTKVSVTLPGGRSEPPSEAYASAASARHLHHGHAHVEAESHGHDHADHAHAPGDMAGHHQHGGDAHRHLSDLLGIIERAPLSARVKERAASAFRLLCDEEGRVHGVPATSVALHEVGAVDAIIDIVGAIEGFEILGIDTVYSRPVSLGNGWVRAAHGVIAVPAPVTLRLLDGVEIGPDGPVTGEATTPTGAVLLRVLGHGSPPPRWRSRATGWGAGGRDPEHYPNALRLILAEAAEEAAMVTTVSADVDDLSPEYLEPLREALAIAGAIDVQVWGTMMKKGRPGFRIEVICDTAAAERVTEALFLHSTTAGVRRVSSERVTLPRRQIQIEAADGIAVAVKVLDSPAGPRVKAEYEDVRRAALRLGRPAIDVAREIEAAARAQLAGTVAGSSQSLKEQG
jgi:pyridinium-3,5-bisthiocarboxylic acid mononucleotide nickel chelatase